VPVAKLCSMVVRAAVVSVAAAVAVAAGPAATSREPVPVDRVPASIPSGGVNVTDVIVLLPPKNDAGAISAAGAVALAQRSAKAGVWHHAVPVPATIAGPVAVAPDARHTHWTTLRDEPAWVVTFTSAKPQHVGFTPGAGSSVTHLSVVIDANDGRFVRGFFTP
jgi:hypothetical protein